jgi:hypothetical protein
MKNLLRVTSASNTALRYTASLRSFSGFSAEQSFQLGIQGSSSVNTSSVTTFSTPADLYGTLTLRADEPRKFIAELIRIREVGGKVDIALTTAVQ